VLHARSRTSLIHRLSLSIWGLFLALLVLLCAFGYVAMRVITDRVVPMVAQRSVDLRARASEGQFLQAEQSVQRLQRELLWRLDHADRQAALARFDGVVLEALRETQTLLARYANDLQRNQALRDSRDAARDAARYNRRLYQEGRLDYLASLDSERTLAATETALARSDAELSEDQVALFLALGGGWQNSEPGPAPAVSH